MGTISDWRHLKVNLKEKYLCVNSTTQRFFKIFFGGIFIFFFVLYEKKGCSKKIMKTFLNRRIFSFATGVNDTGVGGAP
jgi:hypothetical protein